VIDWHPSRQTLRQFAWALVAASALLAAAGGLRGACVPAAAGVGGLFLPRALLPLYRLLALVSYPVGYLVSRLLLAAIFYLILTPTGLLMKLFGADPLRLKRVASESSGWLPLTQESGLERYKKLF